MVNGNCVEGFMAAANNIQVIQIGIIHTPYKKAAGTPIQAVFAEGAQGRVEVHPDYAAGLKDLDGFDRIWLIYWFDRAATCRLEVTPYMDMQTHGVFATRAPARPNPIGISSVKLERIEGGTLYVRDVDMLDGTPLLDIKPYSPEFDCFEVARCGWMNNAKNGNRTADERFHK